LTGYEAKTRFAELIERVERRERIVITRHGVAVAVLPLATQDAVLRQAAARYGLKVYLECSRPLGTTNTG